MPETLFNLRLDEEDRALLEACSTKEKLSKSDIFRRALRAYAENLGVTEQRQRPKPKPKRR